MKILVAYEGYFKDSGVTIYEGTSKTEILRWICNAHSYGCPDEASEKEIMSTIAECNGDGCDYILCIYDIENDSPIFPDDFIEGENSPELVRVKLN